MKTNPFKTMHFKLHNNQIASCNSRVDVNFVKQKYKTNNIQTALQYVIANDDLNCKQSDRQQILFDKKLQKGYALANAIRVPLDADVLDYVS